MNENKLSVRNGIKFSQVMTIEDDGDIVVSFPDTKRFISQIEMKKNAEKLHNVLKRTWNF